MMTKVSEALEQIVRDVALKTDAISRLLPDGTDSELAKFTQVGIRMLLADLSREGFRVANLLASARHVGDFEIKLNWNGDDPIGDVETKIQQRLDARKLTVATPENGGD